MELEAVIFDLGGTLISYAGPYEKWPELETPGFLAAYEELGKQGVSLPPFASFRDGGLEMLPGRWQQAAAGKRNLRLVELLADLLQFCEVDEISQSQLLQATEAYQSAVRAQASVMPAAQEVLAYVTSQGYKTGLLSNTMFTGQAHIEDLEQFGLMEYFDVTLFSADVNMWKPNEAPFIHLLEALRVSAEAAVFIGDDPAVDVVGGRRVGMRTVHINSSRRFPGPEHVKPHAQIANLKELPALLSSWDGE